MKRENIFSTRPALGPSFVGEAILTKCDSGVVKTMREGERRAAVTVRAAVSGADVLEKLVGQSALPEFPCRRSRQICPP